MTFPAHVEMYLARGWRLFVCEPRTKRPLGELCPHGVYDATTDRDTLAKWLRLYPDANLAVACGSPGPQALDIDYPDRATAAVIQAVKAAPHMMSGDQGKHKGGACGFFAGTDAATTDLGYGELRGRGSYQMLPPSVHPGGTRYRWLREPRGPLPPAPVLDRQAQHPGRGEHHPPARPLPHGKRHPYLKDFAVRLAWAGLTDPDRIAAHLELEFRLSCEITPPPAPGYFQKLAEWVAGSHIAAIVANGQAGRLERLAEQIRQREAQR